MLLFYVRHGDPIYNPDSLTELGEKQAEALVSRMKVCNPEKIYASSSNRAIMTATPTAKALGKEIEILDWCNESYSGKALFYTGSDGSRDWIFRHRESRPVLVSDEVRKLDYEWYKHPFFDKMPWLCDEMARIRRETDAFMLSLGYRHEGNGYIAERPNDDRVALFAHQGFGLEFLSTLLDIPYSQFATRFDMGHSGMTVIEFAGDGFVVPKVLQLSNDSHLFASNIETKYHNEILF